MDSQSKSVGLHGQKVIGALAHKGKLGASVPPGTGKGRGHLQRGNVVKCFCALVVTAKRSVDELFMRHFHNLSSTSGGFAPDHTWAPSLDPAGALSFPNLPTPGKNPAGSYDGVNSRNDSVMMASHLSGLLSLLFC